ncbi:Outer membrane efflux protein [Roseovarius gaetbuli]|uniref:Outer membrane efflux protein n=1 Tax=Roseovarius gaetbuli TaxID=1356575 RepID=A0A1X7AF41_9RHOB|nr:TolC family protein [Roseovarius gaetbuli]SLN76378.1 Outer membrane efflux protein [Roseovarius gaetbuli]
MRVSCKSGLALSAALLISACASPQQVARFADPKAAFAPVSDNARKVLGKDTALLMDAPAIEANAKRVHAMVQGKTLDADTAVQVALLNNRGLQAAYAQLGVSSAEAWQSIMTPNPVVSIGVLGINADGVGAFRSIEGVIANNLQAAFTQEGRSRAADVKFRQAQLTAVEKTLSVAVDTRRAWVDAVAAFEAAGLIREAQGTADAASELAARLGDTGYLNKADQAREHAFYAELTGQRAQAKLAATLAKEALTRQMGLWGQDVTYFVPNALPRLPRQVKSRPHIERDALKSRVDLAIARLDLDSMAKARGMTEATRYVTDLELVVGAELERENDGGGIETKTTPQVELDFAIPIFDSGKARLKRAEAAYMLAAHQLAERAVNVRSEARAAHASYVGTHQIAGHYRNAVLPLRQTIEEEALLSYNGMITNTFELLADTRARLNSNLTEASARRDFWQAEANLVAAVHGGGGGGAGSGGDTQASVAGDGSGGH